MALCLSILAPISGCGDKPTASAEADAAAQAEIPVLLKGLRIIDGTPPDRRPITFEAAALEAPLRRAFGEAGYEGEAGKAPPEHVWKVQAAARVIYGLTTGEGLLSEIPETPVEGLSAKVVWTVEVKFKDSETYDNQYVVFEMTEAAPITGAQSPEALKAALQAQLDAGAKAVSGRLAGHRAVLVLPRAEVEARLADESPAIRQAAVDRLAALGDKAAVPALVKRVEVETERGIKLRIVGALEELRDPRAEEALIALANPRDREMLHAVVLALAVLETPKARDFLDILATHDAPDVRALVQAARAQMDRGAPKGPAPDAQPDGGAQP